MGQFSRRSFLNQSTLALAAAGGLASQEVWAGTEPALPKLPFGKPTDVSRNEGYWAEIAAQYTLPKDFINLENGYFGVMAKPVMEEYKKNIDYVNQYSSYFLRKNFDATGMAAIRAQVAQAVGAQPEEIALTRGATEALQNLIADYRLLKQGDVVMYADLDYPSTQYAMNSLKERRGVEVVKIIIPSLLRNRPSWIPMRRRSRAHPEHVCCCSRMRAIARAS